MVRRGVTARTVRGTSFFRQDPFEGALVVVVFRLP